MSDKKQSEEKKAKDIVPKKTDGIVHDDKNIPEEVAEILDEMPPQIRRSVTMAMMQTSMRGGVGHPLFEKFTPEHVSKFLDYSQQDDQNEFKLKSSNRWFHLLYTMLGLGFFMFLVLYLLPLNQDLFTEILKLMVVFAGGLGSGYGLKSLRK